VTTCTQWPDSSAYTLAQHCSRCGSNPGEVCRSPRTRVALHGHAARQDAGWRHYRRDLARAPWLEDWVPGVRYDSLPDVHHEPDTQQGGS
jgi:hypothetical protein